MMTLLLYTSKIAIAQARIPYDLFLEPIVEPFALPSRSRDECAPSLSAKLIGPKNDNPSLTWRAPHYLTQCVYEFEEGLHSRWPRIQIASWTAIIEQHICPALEER